MKLKSLSSLIALSMVAGSAFATQIEVSTDKTIARVGHNMMTVNATANGDYTLTPMSTARGLTFSPSTCETTIAQPTCQFTVSGQEGVKAGPALIKVAAPGAKAGTAYVKLVAADAHRMYLSSKDGSVMGAINGNTFVYSADGGHTFKSMPAPKGATEVNLINSGGQGENKRFFATFVGTNDVLWFDASTGKLIKSFKAPKGFEHSRVFVFINENQAGVPQAIIDYYGSSTATIGVLIDANGNVKHMIEQPEGAGDSSVIWPTANGGFLMTYMNTFNTNFVDAKGNVVEVKAPADAGSGGYQNEHGKIQVVADNGDNGLTVITYSSPTAIAIDSEDNTHTVAGPKDAVKAYLAKATPNNQMVISYYKELFQSQYDGKSNDLVVVNSDGSSRVVSVPGTENAGGFEGAALAGNEVLLFWYDADSYHVYYPEGTNKKVALNAIYTLDGAGQIGKLTLPENAVVGNDKANIHNYSVKSTAKLLAFDNTSDVLLIKADNSTQVIPAPKGATGVLWSSAGGNDFAVTYKDSTNPSGSLGVVKLVSSDGQSYEVAPAARMVSQSCHNGVCETQYENAPVKDVITSESDNFAIRYLNGKTKVVFNNGVEQVVDSTYVPNVYPSAHGDFIVANKADKTIYYFTEKGEKEQIALPQNAYNFDWVYNTAEGDFLITFQTSSQAFDQYGFEAMKDVLFVGKDGDKKTIQAPQGALSIPDHNAGHEHVGMGSFDEGVDINITGQATITYNYATKSEPQTTTIITNTGDVKYW